MDRVVGLVGFRCVVQRSVCAVAGTGIGCPATHCGTPQGVRCPSANDSPQPLLFLPVALETRVVCGSSRVRKPRARFPSIRKHFAGQIMTYRPPSCDTGARGWPEGRGYFTTAVKRGQSIDRWPTHAGPHETLSMRMNYCLPGISSCVVASRVHPVHGHGVSW